MNNRKHTLSTRRPRRAKHTRDRSFRYPTTALRFLSMVAPTVLLIGGCALQPTASEPAEDQIVVSAWEEAPDNDPQACRVGYDLVYPADLEPRQFNLVVALGREIAPGNPEGALRENGGTLLIPRPDNDHRVDRSDPNANVFRVQLMTFSPCVQTQFGEAFLPTLEFRRGSCTQPHCDALQFEMPSNANRVRFRVIDAGDER